MEFYQEKLDLADRKVVDLEMQITKLQREFKADRKTMQMKLDHMQHAVAKYNKQHKVVMPSITPHICRHTYCTEMAKTGINPKTLQYLMGHSEISVTLNVYTHLGFDDAKEELDKLFAVKSVKIEGGPSFLGFWTALKPL